MKDDPLEKLVASKEEIAFLKNTGYLRLNTFEAIKYLSDNSVYSNEWTGAGMWEAVKSVLRKEVWSHSELDLLLEKAKDF